MKTIGAILLALLMSSMTFSQTRGINYKAVIKDNLGNVVANTNVTVQFTILKGVAQTNVYRENHTPTTDANGIIITNIGEGTLVSGNFNTIVWSNDTYYLNTQVNTGSGLVDMGTTEFKSVPYALQAEKAANVSGLESLNEGNGLGWRLIGYNPTNYGNIGSNAVDVSFSSSASTINGATGSFTFASGINTIAAGPSSTAMGNFTRAIGDASTALGLDNFASGDASTVLGTENEATGFASIALGRQTTAIGEASTAMGFDNIAGGFAATALGQQNSVDGYASVVAGFNSSATGNYSRALGVSTHANGNYSTAIGSSAIASADYSIALGNQVEASGLNATAIGYQALASGFHSTSLGETTTAVGDFSNAFGYYTNADANTSTAIGRYNVGGGSATLFLQTNPLFEVGNGTSSLRSNALTILQNGTITAPSFDIAEITDPKALITKEYADTNLSSTGLEAIDEGSGVGWRLKGRNPAFYGNIGFYAVDLSISVSSGIRGATGGYSTAFGGGTTASGDYSTALGIGSTASGHYSTALGLNTIANSYSSLAAGRNNVGGGSIFSWIATDPLFEIGNGSSSAARANALTVLKNGNVGIGIANPVAKLQVNGRILFGSNEYIEDGGSAIVAVDGGLRSTLNGLDDLGTSTNRWRNIYATNGTINTSDRRDKTNINDLSYGLKDLMKLKPVSFNWKSNPNEDRKLGLIAQDLLEVIPEVVKTRENVIIDENDRTKTKSVEMDRMGVYYSDLIPVLIKAMQEQQQIIDTQNKNYQQLLERIEKLEANNKKPIKIMKTTLIFILAFVMSSMTFSQTRGINYKAVIKDNLGNVVANTNVTIQFTILKGAAETNIYRENHTPTTDANGIIIVNIGEGTVVSGAFNTIIWSNDSYSLNTQINTGSGLVDIGTTEFKTVPYALNVQGLERLDEGNGYGWRLVGRNPDYYGNIGIRSVDLSIGLTSSTTQGATGFYSAALGANTTASGDIATAIGNGTVASGAASTASGAYTNASGDLSTASGENTIAGAMNVTAMGRFNVGGGNGTSWLATDPLFEIGNGTGNATRTNALTVLKNGTITAPTLTNSLINTAGNKALITKEYLDANGATGLEALNEGNGIGWRLKGRPPTAYGNIGNNAVDFSTSQDLIDIGALGTTSFASGRDTRAQGGFSTAMGNSTVASADSSTALGAYTNASGLVSTSLGYYSTASGFYSLATGASTKANAYSSTAIGSNNIGGGNPTTWVATDPLFEIGNGTSTPANAVTVLKNGNVGIGIANPTAKLQLNGRFQFGSTEYFEDGGSSYISCNGTLNPSIDGGYNLGISSKRWNAVYALNGTINTSDRRDKTNISELNYGLKELMKLKPVSFNWKNNPNEDKKLGLIAQDLLQIIPEVVKTNENVIIDENDGTKTKPVEMDRMGVYYSDLIPVLIKSIQEQQAIIDGLIARIEVLENK